LRETLLATSSTSLIYSIISEAEKIIPLSIVVLVTVSLNSKSSVFSESKYR